MALIFKRSTETNLSSYLLKQTVRNQTSCQSKHMYKWTYSATIMSPMKQRGGHNSRDSAEPVSVHVQPSMDNVKQLGLGLHVRLKACSKRQKLNEITQIKVN